VVSVTNLVISAFTRSNTKKDVPAAKPKRDDVIDI
jgi:hypothetical protein